MTKNLEKVLAIWGSILAVGAPNPLDAINNIFQQAINQITNLANWPAGLVIATGIGLTVVFKWIRKVKWWA